MTLNQAKIFEGVNLPPSDELNFCLGIIVAFIRFVI